VLKNYAERQADFTANVYKEIIKSKSDNFVVSPVSANVILALVHQGAKGKTAEQLAAGLNLPTNGDKIKEIFQEVIPYLQSKTQYNLTSANKVYLQEGFEITEQFKNTAVNVFDSDIQNVDFEKNEQAASEINKWVEEKTNYKIKDLVSKDSLDASTCAVLINALYFEGKWSTPFESSHTSKRPFYKNMAKIDIDMMEQTEYFNYFESSEWGAQILEIPYKGGDVTMTIILPNGYDDLPTLETRIAAGLFIAPEYKKERVHLVVPKFKTEASIEFKPILQALGIVDAFEDSADLSGIGVHTNNLKISKVTQKAFIEVEEEGTTAAAATVVFVGFGSSAPSRHSEPKEFIVNHSFLYYLRSPAGILFVGRYISP